MDVDNEHITRFVSVWSRSGIFMCHTVVFEGPLSSPQIFLSAGVREVL